MWRIYNHYAGYETLREDQVNNPKGCKLGKWIEAQKDPNICNNQAFLLLKENHNELHKWATSSWRKKNNNDDEGALQDFNKTYEVFQDFKKSMYQFMKYMEQNGYREKTDYQSFQ